jgi:hypothetical protein
MTNSISKQTEKERLELVDYHPDKEIRKQRKLKKQRDIKKDIKDIYKYQREKEWQNIDNAFTNVTLTTSDLGKTYYVKM